MHDARRLTALIVLIVILIAVLYVIDLPPGKFPLTTHPTVAKVSYSPTFPPPPPPLTPEIEAMLKKSNGFQVLSSYTDRGFEPAIISIKKGETIRFTNNSSHDLWVASIGSGASTVYPGTSNCGSSAFDSCMVLKPGYFWEFTFNVSGKWTYQNVVQRADVASIFVR